MIEFQKILEISKNFAGIFENRGIRYMMADRYDLYMQRRPVYGSYQANQYLTPLNVSASDGGEPINRAKSAVTDSQKRGRRSVVHHAGECGWLADG